MSVSIRFYLFAADGLQRISQRVMEGLCHGQDAMPQFANTKQRFADVVVELENGKPARILQANGSFLDFDDKGKVHESLVRGGIEALETHAALERSKRTEPSKIVDLSPKLNREKWERECKWELSKQQLDVIADDIWKRKLAATAKVMQAKGAAARPVPLTHEAKEAIREVETQLYGIDLRLQYLSEVALKGFAFEIRARAAREGSDPLWLGLAESADRRREINIGRVPVSGMLRSMLRHGTKIATKDRQFFPKKRNARQKKRPNRLRSDYLRNTQNTSARHIQLTPVFFVTSRRLMTRQKRQNEGV